MNDHASVPSSWPQADGTSVSCVEKLRVLRENHHELHEVMQGAFEDAVLIGVDPAAMRKILTDMVQSLESPHA